jgi:hypothetical protein
MQLTHAEVQSIQYFLLRNPVAQPSNNIVIHDNALVQFRIVRDSDAAFSTCDDFVELETERANIPNAA